MFDCVSGAGVGLLPGVVETEELPEPPPPPQATVPRTALVMIKSRGSKMLVFMFISLLRGISKSTRTTNFWSKLILYGN
jgi:hypothetical protein